MDKIRQKENNKAQQKEIIIKKEELVPSKFVPLEAEEQLIIKGFPMIKRK